MHKLITFQDYKDFKTNFELSKLEEILLPYFQSHEGKLRAIYCWGSTPSWNDGDPCYHSGEITTDFFEALDVLDEDDIFEQVADDETLSEKYTHYEKNDNSVYNKIGITVDESGEFIAEYDEEYSIPNTDLKLIEEIIIEKLDTDFVCVIGYCTKENKLFVEYYDK